jgi:hypothetical protein
MAQAHETYSMPPVPSIGGLQLRRQLANTVYDRNHMVVATWSNHGQFYDTQGTPITQERARELAERN